MIAPPTFRFEPDTLSTAVSGLSLFSLGESRGL
jgi:hypothetical protein